MILRQNLDVLVPKCIGTISFVWHVLKPKHRNSRTLKDPGTPGTPNVTVLFCFPITDHVKNNR